VNKIHDHHLPVDSHVEEPASVPGRAGKIRSLMLVLEGNIPRFPWAPSATRLTYRLAGTTEEFGVLPGRTASSSSPATLTTSPELSRADRRIFASHGEPSKKALNR